MSMAPAAALAAQVPAQAAPQQAGAGLPLEQYQPKSMLHAAETRVPRARYPLLDFHTHISMAGDLDPAGKLRWSATAEECLAVMDRKLSLIHI